MPDGIRQACDGSDDPRERCGLHHDTGTAMMGGYACCCGGYWTSKNRCSTGAASGDRVSVEDKLSEMLAYTIADAPHDIDAHVRGVLDVLRADGVLESSVPYRTCFECGHVYPTAADLLAEHAALVARINRESWPDTPPMVAQTDPDRVYACPACAHDF